MAIKGKRRSRGGRTVAAPPRPQLVVRRRPFWQRTWFWITIGVVVVIAIVFGVVANMRANDREDSKKRQLAAVQNFSSAVQAEFPDDRSVVPPDLIIPFPTFRQTVDDLSSGKMKPAAAAVNARDVMKAASDSASGIRQIDTASMIPDQYPLTRAQMNDVKGLFVQSFRLYQDAATLTLTATTLQGDEQKAVLRSAGDVLTRASLLFQSGNTKLSRSITALGGTFQEVQAPQPSPSPTPSTSPSPSASPSAPPSTSPSPSESATSPTSSASPSP
jgi:hypothetical protein